MLKLLLLHRTVSILNPDVQSMDILCILQLTGALLGNYGYGIKGILFLMHPMIIDAFLSVLTFLDVLVLLRPGGTHFFLMS